MQDSMKTVVLSDCIRNCRKDMQRVPVNHWIWKSNVLSICEFIRKLRELENDSMVIGTYAENYFKVDLITNDGNEEQLVVPFTGGEFNLSQISEFCKQATKELAKFYDCRFRIKYKVL